MNDWLSTFIDNNCCPICKKSTKFKQGFKKDNTIVFTNVKNSNSYIIWGTLSKKWKAYFSTNCYTEHMIKYTDDYGKSQFVEFIPEYSATYEVGWNGQFYLNKISEKLYWPNHKIMMKCFFASDAEIIYNNKSYHISIDCAMGLRESDNLIEDIKSLQLFM